MERIIHYEELPRSKGQSIYLRMETDPKLYVTLMTKGYKIVNHINQADNKTIFVTGKRQAYEASTREDYISKIEQKIQDSLQLKGITKPKTVPFSFEDLMAHKYQVPFVFKNENQNGGREKFLIATEKDYENLMNTCNFLLKEDLVALNNNDIRYFIDYKKYLESGFTIQEYVDTPTEYNTTIRLLTSSAKQLLYGSLKYNKQEPLKDETTLIGYLLHHKYPLSTKSIVSNTLSGGENILLGEKEYSKEEQEILEKHNISSDNFQNLIQTTEEIHDEFQKELGIICGFDYIYDKEKDKWFLLEEHSRPMVGDYSKRQGLAYTTHEDRLIADGRVRATSLSLHLK